MWDAVKGGLQPQPWHRNIIQARRAQPYHISPKIHPHLNTYYGYNDAPICPSTASQGAKIFVYIQYGCGMQSMGVVSLYHDTTTSYRLAIPHFPWNSPPPANLLQHKDAPTCPSTASQGAKTLCISNMDVGCSQWGFLASTMILKHHTGLAIPHFP